MIYRENGQFKTSYLADQQIFTIAQDKWFVLGLIAFAAIGVPMLADEYLFRAILIPFLLLSLAALGPRSSCATGPSCASAGLPTTRPRARCRWPSSKPSAG